MKKPLRAIAGLAVTLGIGGSACGQSDMTSNLSHLTNTDGEVLTQLTDDELKSLLPGTGLSNVPRTQFVEGFECEGTWTLAGARAPIRGRYSIRDQQYCIEVTGEPHRCHKLFRTETGKLFGEVGPTPFGEIEVGKPARACPQR